MQRKGFSVNYGVFGHPEKVKSRNSIIQVKANLAKAKLKENATMNELTVDIRWSLEIPAIRLIA